MGAEEVFDGDDAGMLVEMGQGAGFFEKAIQAVGELVAGWAGIDGQADPGRRPRPAQSRGRYSLIASRRWRLSSQAR